MTTQYDKVKRGQFSLKSMLTGVLLCSVAFGMLAIGARDPGLAVGFLCVAFPYLMFLLYYGLLRVNSGGRHVLPGMTSLHFRGLTE